MSFTMTTKTFHILADESLGMEWDAKIIANTLASNFHVTVNIRSKWNLVFHVRRVILKIKRFFGFRDSISILIEDVRPRWLGAFAFNVLLPNHEIIRPNTARLLGSCDEVWCKTKYAQMLFARLGCNTRYIGFTSTDRYVAKVPKFFELFIHVQGKSSRKGTAAILEAWGKHPQWPVLTIVTRETHLVSHNRHNIKVITDFLTDAELNEYMNSAGVHVCTSEAEGFGHSINEALSTGALVISTDAPPMNELVRPEFGLLVPFVSSSPEGLGENFKVSSVGLAQTIEKSLMLSQAEKERMGQAARAAYLKGKSDFQVAILSAAECVTVLK